MTFSIVSVREDAVLQLIKNLNINFKTDFIKINKFILIHITRTGIVL